MPDEPTGPEPRDGFPRAAVFVKPKRARPFFGRHPWVLESAVLRVEGDPAAGDVVDLVTHDGQLYECIADNTGQIPSGSPESWTLLPPPVDDLRVVPGSAYDGIGIR